MSSSRFRRLHSLFPTAKTSISPSKAPTPTPINDLSPPLPNSSGCDRQTELILYEEIRHSLKQDTLETVVKKFIKASETKRFRCRGHLTYDNIVRHLAAAQKFSYIEDILEHQKNYVEITHEGFTVRLISLYGKSGMFDQAHKLFDEMPLLNCVRTVMSMNALLTASVNSKKYDKTAELLRELPEKLSIEPDRISYNIMIKALCETGCFDSALSVIHEMEKYGVEPDLVSFNTLIGAFYRNGRFADAEKVWAMMEKKNFAPDVRSYEPKLRALVADNRISEAVELFEEMQSKGVKPNLYSLNHLIKGYCAYGNMVEAKRWYNEIAKNGHKPNQMTFTELGNLACDKGDFSLGFSLCKEAIRLHGRVNAEMMQLVVDGLVKESKMDEAEVLVMLGKSL